MSYRGPHVAVKQQFEISPPGVAIDNLAPVAIGTAYDVYRNESLGTFSAAEKELGLGWVGGNKVVHDRSVAGSRVYDFYPVSVKADTSFGIVDITDHDKIDEIGVQVSDSDTFIIPGSSVAAGQSNAYMPYYKEEGTGILSISGNKIALSDSSVLGAGLVPGQKVFLKDGAIWEPAGNVRSISADGTVITLVKDSTASGDDGIVIGAAHEDRTNIPNTIFDPTIDFNVLEIKFGQIVGFRSQSFTGVERASITSVVNNHTLFINTDGSAVNFYDDIRKSEDFDIASESRINISEYEIQSYLAFSQNLGLSAQTISDVAINSFKIVSASADAQKIKAGCFVYFDESTVTETDVKAWVQGPLTVKSAVMVGDDLLVTVEENIDTTTILNGWHVAALCPKITSSIIADYRAIKSQERMVRHRISSPENITDLYGSISPYNDLAQMLAIQLATSGGASACYAVNVDSSAESLSGEYNEALELMKMVDVYTHVLGTTDAGVNGIMGSYVDQQADPYEGHERTAILCYDDLSLFKITDAGFVTLSGQTLTVSDVDLTELGVMVGDWVVAYDSKGNVIGEARVALTPSDSDVVELDGDFPSASVANISFYLGSKTAQADSIRNIRYGNRRIKVIWPGYFQANSGDDVITNLPPYYIASAIAGFDALMNPSQSFTNMNFSLPGFSNIALNTSSYFNKTQLDRIGGGGVDIMIQEGNMTNTIRSRHSLTSNMDAIELREWSVTKQGDVSAKTFRRALSPYPGRYNISPKLIQFVSQIGNAVAAQLEKDGIVASVTVVSVARDEIVKDKLNIIVNITVYIAGNYYDVTLNLKS